MPEHAPAKRVAGPLSVPPRVERNPGYAELHCKTNYSFLEGASHPDELVVRAAELGYRALAITDTNSLAGVVRAHVAAKEVGLPLLIGAQITPADAWPVVLLATDRAAYGRLARLITLGRRQAAKGECYLTLDDVADYAAGLLALIAPPRGWRRHKPPPSLAIYRETFGGRCHLLAEPHCGSNDARQLDALIELAHEVRIPTVAAGDVHYHEPNRQYLHDVLTATRLKTTVAAAAGNLFPNAQRHLKSLEKITNIFARYPEMVARTVEVAACCTFSLDELRYEYPEELAPAGFSPLEYLAQLTWKGASQRYPHGVPEEVRRLIEHELALIEKLRYEAYFLTVWDLVRFARSRGILCQGRGSAANSAVCYCLEVTSVDPVQVDLMFERFVSKERDEAPDIDVDFEHERREEVLQYIYGKYGRERAGMTAEVITYRARSAIRDVGKALGLSPERVDSLAKVLNHFGDDQRLSERFREVGFDPSSRVARQLVALVQQLIGFPRHLSQHVGGMVITRGPLSELVPIENAAMPGRTVVQWDKDDLDALGILKVDCLALGMLTAIRKCFDLIARHSGRRLTLATIPPGDTEVYDMICRADTVGVFQIESRAQMSMLPRLKPRCYYDLVIEVAIVRPGPIQGDMVHPYLRRRNGEEEVVYPSEAIREVLEKTLGVPIFQEQAMRLAVVAAGFTPGEADQLRRAMGAWRKTGLIEQFRQRLLDGMRTRGLSEEFAQNLFNQIRGFGEYGFPESHAASFALLVYVSAWLKHYYPAAFCAAVINSQPMGFYAPAQLVRDAREHDVEVLPVDVSVSDWDCTLEGSRLRLGFRLVAGLPQAAVEKMLAVRASCPFDSLNHLIRRTQLNRVTLVKLATADAFGSFGLTRREALWQVLAQDQPLPLFASLETDDEAPVPLPRMEPAAEVVADYRTVGLSLKAHPIQFIRPLLDELNVTPAEQLSRLASGRRLKTAGLVLLRQRPSTAKGITFVTLEDETGISNLVITQDVWERYRTAARRASVLVAQGRLERQGQVIHIKVQKLDDFSSLVDARQRSRDFR